MVNQMASFSTGLNKNLQSLSILPRLPPDSNYHTPNKPENKDQLYVVPGQMLMKQNLWRLHCIPESILTNMTLVHAPINQPIADHKTNPYKVNCAWAVRRASVSRTLFTLPYTLVRSSRHLAWLMESISNVI